MEDLRIEVIRPKASRGLAIGRTDWIERHLPICGELPQGETVGRASKQLGEQVQGEVRGEVPVGCAGSWVQAADG